jgi:hypothetical protein
MNGMQLTNVQTHNCPIPYMCKLINGVVSQDIAAYYRILQVMYWKSCCISVSCRTDFILSTM